MSKQLILLCFCVLFLIHSCQRPNEFTFTKEAITITQAKQWFEANGYPSAKSGRLSSYDHILFWEIAQEKNLDGWQVVEVPFDSTYIPTGTISKLLFFKDEKGQIQFQILHIIGEDQYVKTHHNQFNPVDFTGVVNVLDPNEKFINGLYFENGTLIGQYSAPEKNKGARIQGECREIITTYWVQVCVGGSCGSPRVDYTTTSYLCDNSTGASVTGPGSSGGGGYGGTTGGGGGKGGCGTAKVCPDGTQNFNTVKVTPRVPPVVAAINSSIRPTLQPCMQKILTEIQTLSTTSKVGGIINSFIVGGANKPMNWTLTNTTLGPNSYGITLPVYSTITESVTTYFDASKFTNATDISIARTFLHESVHAYLVYILFMDPANAQRNYPILIQDYTRTLNYNAAQHDEFVRNFKKNIADALQEYGTKKGYGFVRQFYDDMAWGGLEDTGAFKALSADNQKRIIDTIRIELTNRDYNGNFKKQLGVKAGC